MKCAVLTLLSGLLLSLSSCDPSSNTVYPEQNQTANNLVQVDACGEPADLLAMMAAPVVISQAHDGCFQLNITTAIVKDDGAHSLASACTELMHMELYYSRSRDDLESLDGLATTASGANFDLPSSVGRLVESRSVNPIGSLFEFYIASRGGGSPNRSRYSALLPNNILDLSEGGAIGANLGSNVQLYYRWAKRIEEPNDADPMVFSKEVYAINFPGSISAVAGNDQTITAPDENAVILSGSVNPLNAELTKISWTWVDPLQHPGESASIIPPVITSPGSLTTNVIFTDHGKFDFSLEVTTACGKTSSDMVSIFVNGFFTSPASRNVLLQSAESCARDGLGRIMSLKNITSSYTTVRVRVFEDFRTWLTPNTPFARGTNEIEREVSVPGNQSIVLGCSVEYGEGSTGSDWVTRTWSIISERAD